MDCTLHHLGNCEHFKRTCITDTGFKLSVLVRNNMFSRQDAIVKEQKEIEFLKRYFDSENLEIRQVLENLPLAIKSPVYSYPSTLSKRCARKVVSVARISDSTENRAPVEDG